MIEEEEKRKKKKSALKYKREGRNIMIAGLVVVFFAILFILPLAYIGAGLMVGGLIRWGWGKHKEDKELEE
jgi:hypothetical protein